MSRAFSAQADRFLRSTQRVALGWYEGRRWRREEGQEELHRSDYLYQALKV
jgi:hypothetical protein